MGANRSLVKPNEPGHKKRLGQHFLRDTGVINRIVSWIQPSCAQVFLEIGAGGGALSLQLAPRVSRLLAVEIDSDCIPSLESSLAAHPSAIVIEADFLQLDLVELVSPHLKQGQMLRIAGNLPYNIATAIIEKLLHAPLPVLDMTFMVQLEVAERITASPGTKQYGYFSVECQHHSDVRFGFKVSPACFVPRPKVSSAVISLRPKPLSMHSLLEEDFQAITKAAFGYRRKTLQNSLSRHPSVGRLVHILIEKAGIRGERRAEQLTVHEFEKLAQVWHELKWASGYSRIGTE